MEWNGMEYTDARTGVCVRHTYAVMSWAGRPQDMLPQLGLWAASLVLACT